MKRFAGKRIARALMIFGILCLVLAVVWIAENLRESENAGAAAKSVLEKLQAAVTQNAALGPDPKGGAAVVKIDGERYLGILSLPSLDLELPVAQDYSEARMKTTPCRYAGSPETGMTIAGHNYASHFGALGALKPGETVYFVFASGKRSSYTVDHVEILGADRVEEMTESAWALTLFTCTLSGKERVTVRCFKNFAPQAALPGP